MNVDEIYKMAEYLDRDVEFALDLYLDGRGGDYGTPYSPTFSSPDDAYKWLIQEIKKNPWISGSVVASLDDEIIIKDVDGYSSLSWISKDVKSAKKE